MLKGSEDYSDCALCVYELSEDGSWNHHHLNPLYLKKNMYSRSNSFKCVPSNE